LGFRGASGVSSRLFRSGFSLFTMILRPENRARRVPSSTPSTASLEYRLHFVADGRHGYGQAVPSSRSPSPFDTLFP
jgi:hypothetical protein